MSLPFPGLWSVHGREPRAREVGKYGTALRVPRDRRRLCHGGVMASEKGARVHFPTVISKSHTSEEVAVRTRGGGRVEHGKG